jgi:hypothetical protein
MRSWICSKGIAWKTTFSQQLLYNRKLEVNVEYGILGCNVQRSGGKSSLHLQGRKVRQQKIRICRLQAEPTLCISSLHICHNWYRFYIIREKDKLFTYGMSRGTSLGIGTDYGLGSIPDRSNIFFLLHNIPTACGSHPASYPMGN